MSDEKKELEDEECDPCEGCDGNFCSACEHCEDNSQDYSRQQEFAQRLPAYIAKGDTRFFS